MYIQRSVQHNLFIHVFREATCFGFHKAILRPFIDCTVVHHWSKINEWPKDGFVKAETRHLFEYVNKQVVLDWSLYVHFPYNTYMVWYVCFAPSSSVNLLISSTILMIMLLSENLWDIYTIMTFSDWKSSYLPIFSF
jgi:hypothetical protein